MYGTEENHPKLTFIVVQKRHNTRFFMLSRHKQSRSRSHDPSNSISNMSIGTVIDTAIVHRNHINFYLNSHNAYQGVNHPSHYHVLLNDIEFTSDQLKLITFHLCFTDCRSSAAEAIPSVVHQADVAAINARDLFYNNNNK